MFISFNRITVSLLWVFTNKSTLNQPQSTVDVNAISHYNPYRSTIIHKSYTHPYKPLIHTLTHSLSISFHPPTLVFSCTFIPFLASFPALPPPFYFAPLSLSSHSLLRSIQTHTHTRTHTVILSLSHRGTLIKLGWSLMLSPMATVTMTRLAFQKKKKKHAHFTAIRHAPCSSHTPSQTHRHARAIRQTK